MGNDEILHRGDVQLSSTGIGASHSEQAYGDSPVHLLQIWSVPSTAHLTPKYFTRHFTERQKQDKWVAVVAPTTSAHVSMGRTGTGPAPVSSPLTMYATLLSSGKTLVQYMQGRKGYIHFLQTSGYNRGRVGVGQVNVIGGNGVQSQMMKEGDGAYLFVGAAKEVTLENVGETVAEIILFDLE